MGWNSWNKFGCDVSETLIRETADAMVASGMKARRLPVRRHRRLLAGGARPRTATSSPIPQRFPAGMRALARLRARARAEVRHVLGRGHARRARAGPAATATSARTRSTTRPGAWTTSSTTGATPRASTRTSDLHARCATRSTPRPADRLQPVRMGHSKPWTWAKRRRPLWRTPTTSSTAGMRQGRIRLAGRRRHPRHQAPLARYAGPGGMERSRHAGSGQRRDDRAPSTARTSRCGRCWPRR